MNLETIIETWKECYGEDMEIEYPGFFKKLALKELGEKISEIINEDGDYITDGEVVDEIIDLLKEKDLYIERV